MNVSIGEAALIIGVSVSTLREWDKNETFKPTFRTVGGHRRYSFIAIRKFIGECTQVDDRLVIAYARVSSHDRTVIPSDQRERRGPSGDSRRPLSFQNL